MKRKIIYVYIRMIMYKNQLVANSGAIFLARERGNMRAVHDQGFTVNERLVGSAMRQ